MTADPRKATLSTSVTQMTIRAFKFRFVAAAACTMLGCNDSPTPSSQPTKNSAATSNPVTQPASQPVAAILPESTEWSRDVALGRLRADDATEIVRRSAAVRLTRLAAVPIGCLPDEATDKWLAGLRVLHLGSNRWAMGIAGEEPRTVGMPALISEDGRVQALVPETEEEAATLVVSDDAEIFPHLVITPMRVQIVTDVVRSALVAKSMGGARFAYCRKDDRWPYVGVRFTPKPSSSPTTGPRESKTEDIEVAQYRWDPDEGAFIGPERDFLPGSQEERFVLDLRESKLLIPVGGEIQEPTDPSPANPPIAPRRDRNRPPD